MSAFGIKIIKIILIPYSFGILLFYFGVKGIKHKEDMIQSVLYTLIGMFFSLGAIWHLLFVATIDWYS